MTYFRELTSPEDIVRLLKTFGKPVTTLATTEGGLPIQSVRLGGDTPPAVIVKAGSHASEVAGIHAALTLVEEGLDTPHEVHVIPCGSPFDFGGYRRALAHASGEEVEIHSDDECLALLSRLGRRFYEGEHFTLFHVGEMVFAWVDQEKLDARDLFYRQLDPLAHRDPHLRHELAGRRIFFPNALYYDEGRGCYDHGGLASWATPGGQVTNLNRMYDRYDAPVEVRSAREFCERVKPGMVIDLHESCINTRIPDQLRTSGEELGSHFLILPPIHGPGFEAVESPVAEAMVEATQRVGWKCFTKEQLQAAWGYDSTEYFHGYLRYDNWPAMAFYQWAARFAKAAITVETRLDLPPETRVDIHTTLVRAALDRYAQLVEEDR